MIRDVRQRAREAIRDEVADTAFDLFAEHGFDEVTVDDIARETGISRATFFRYFGCKEEAAVAAMKLKGFDPAEALAHVQADSSRSPWQLVRRALEPLAHDIDAEPTRRKARARLVASTPSLRAHAAQRRHVQEEALQRGLMAHGINESMALAIAAASLGALDAAWAKWSVQESHEPTFAQLLDEVFSYLGEGVIPIERLS